MLQNTSKHKQFSLWELCVLITPHCFGRYKGGMGVTVVPQEHKNFPSARKWNHADWKSSGYGKNDRNTRKAAIFIFCVLFYVPTRHMSQVSLFSPLKVNLCRRSEYVITRVVCGDMSQSWPVLRQISQDQPWPTSVFNEHLLSEQSHFVCSDRGSIIYFSVSSFAPSSNVTPWLLSKLKVILLIYRRTISCPIHLFSQRCNCELFPDSLQICCNLTWGENCHQFFSNFSIGIKTSCSLSSVSHPLNYSTLISKHAMKLKHIYTVEKYGSIFHLV